MRRLGAAMMCKPAGRQVLMMTGEGPGTLASVVRPLGMLWSSPCSAPRYLAPSSRVMCYATPPSRLYINVGLALATATCFGYMVLPPSWLPFGNLPPPFLSHPSKVEQGWAWHRSTRPGVSHEVRKIFNRGDGDQLYRKKQTTFPEIQIKRDARLGLLRWELDKPGQLVIVGDQRQQQEEEGEEDMARATMTHLKALEGRTNVAYLRLPDIAHHDATRSVWTQIVGDHLSTAFSPSQEYAFAIHHQPTVVTAEPVRAGTWRWASEMRSWKSGSADRRH